MVPKFQSITIVEIGKVKLMQGLTRAKEFLGRRLLFKRSAAVVGIGAAVTGYLATKVVSPTPVGATESESSSQRKMGLIGAWVLTVTFLDDNTLENDLASFTPGGVVTATSDKSRCTCIGAFKVTGKYTFTYVLREQLFDTNNNHFADLHVYVEATLNNTFDRYEGTGTGTLYTTNGIKVSRRPTSTQAVRIEVKQDE